MGANAVSELPSAFDASGLNETDDQAFLESADAVMNNLDEVLRYIRSVIAEDAALFDESMSMLSRCPVLAPLPPSAGAGGWG